MLYKFKKQKVKTLPLKTNFKNIPSVSHRQRVFLIIDFPNPKKTIVKINNVNNLAKIQSKTSNKTNE